jgi:mannose-1-phosphate guanylyltransferase
MVVTGTLHVVAVRRQLPFLEDADVVAEPSPRDSMAAIALAAAILEHRHGPHVIGSFSADHVIRRPEAFRDAVRTAIAAAEAGEVVTIGIRPRGPSTAFGYIQAGGPLEGIEGARRAEAFTEKPQADVAASFFADGSFYWNAGMFVVRTDVLLRHLARLQGTIEQGVREIAEAWDTPNRETTLARIWPGLTRIAIDHAIAEPVAAAGGVAVVPADIDWYDIGDFSVLASLLPPGPDGVRRVARNAPVIAIDSPGAMVVGGDKAIAIVGLEDVTVVDSPDAVLVLGRAAAQKVKEASEAAR